MKKIIALVACLSLVASLAVGGSIAYLQSTDSAVNVMTLGKVEIEQIEQQENENGELEPFKQGKDFYPGSEISKIVTVKNTGKSDAYFRTLIAFESIDSETFGINFPIGEFNGYKWSWGAPEATIVLDGVTYKVYEAVYQKALPAGEVSPASLTKVEMSEKATNEDMEALGGAYEILVLSQAVQTAGFEDVGAAAALDEAFGDVTNETAAEWFDGMVPVTFVGADEQKAQISGEAAAEVLKDLENGNDLMIDEKVDIIEFADSEVDAKGATVTLNGTGSDAYGYLSFNPGANADASVENLNVTGSGFVQVGEHGQKGGTYVVNNLTIKDMNATLTAVNYTDKLAAAFAHYGNATLNNCTMTGTTTAVEGFTAYDIGFVNKTNTTVNGGEYGSMYVFNHAGVTINGAKVGRIDTSANTVTTDKLIIGADTTVGTINITDATKGTPALVIEEGATVGKIVYGDKTYTQSEWTTANP